MPWRRQTSATQKFGASPSGSLESGSNPPTSSHGHSGAELTRRSLGVRTSMQNGNCNANVAVLVANYPRPKAISSCVERVETRRDLLLAFGIGNPRAFAQVENGAVV